MMARNHRAAYSIIVLFTVAPALFGCDASNSPADADQLVVYCAADEVFSRQIIEQFQQQTGLHVTVRYDTEASKSLGLTELLIQEKDNPRCDVFWNNQWLGTADLKAQGVLQPHRGVGYQRIPDRYKDPDGCFVGFAARLRVYIQNTNRKWSEVGPDSVDALLQSDDLSRTAIAKPIFGTTLSHYTVLWGAHGEDWVRDWHRQINRRGIIQRGGNATVKDLVAQGVCDLGFTDTDDFFVAKDAGAPVAMQPIRIGDNQTICIPNTAAIIQGARHLKNAQVFVDFLLSEETELALARCSSRQIPLGPIDDDRLPEQVRQLRRWSQDGYDLRDLEESRAGCLKWLKSEYGLD